MKISRLHGAMALALASVVVLVGCAVGGGAREELPPASAERRAGEYSHCDAKCLEKLEAWDRMRGVGQPPEPLIGHYPPNCDPQCRQAWDQMRGRPSPQVITAAASAASASSKSGCPVARPKLALKKKEAKPCSGTTATPPAPVASAASQPALPRDIAALSTALPSPTSAFKLADPVMERRASKQVGSYDWIWDNFGYTDGQLVYRPYWGHNKSVDMTQRVESFSYKCSRLRIPETDRDLWVKITAAINPASVWEVEYHRLVTKYGSIGGLHSNKNVVTADDVKKSVERYVGQHQGTLCRAAAAKSLDDLLRDPSLEAAEELNRYFRRDGQSDFDVLVQTTEVVLTEDDLRAIGLKARTKL